MLLRGNRTFLVDENIYLVLTGSQNYRNVITNFLQLKFVAAFCTSCKQD